MDRPIHVVGGGLGGLVAAITAAEEGAPVILHEATPHLGGRALGGAAPAGVNLGPHVLMHDGAVLGWLRRRKIAVNVRIPDVTRMRLIDERGLHLPLRATKRLAKTVLPATAPVDASFREWTDGKFGSAASSLACQLAGLMTFHHDPGSLSAAFVWERYRRTALQPHQVRSVLGGWTTLIAALEARARRLGVQIDLERRVTAQEFPDAPTVVSLPLAAASHLLERTLRWSGARTAILDVAATGANGWPTIVADVREDLDTCCLVERITARDPSLLGRNGPELFQAQLGIPADVAREQAELRMEDVLDVSVPGWRERTVWRRALVLVDATGAVDPPGTTWRDRPSIEQGDGRFLAGDAVAAPGYLSEVSINSAVRAARLALDARAQRAFAVGWPSVALTPERRLHILAAALPSAHVRLGPSAHGSGESLEPAGETGLGYRITSRCGVVTATTDSLYATDRPTSLVAARWPTTVAGPLTAIVSLAQRARARTRVATSSRSEG